MSDKHVHIIFLDMYCLFVYVSTFDDCISDMIHVSNIENLTHT